jgi:Zn-dependent peptidase ImmA (M78 family)
MTSKSARTPYQEATKLLEKFDIVKPPVQVEKIARWLDAHIRFSPLDDEISGMIYIRDDIPIIGVNSLHRPNRQRFTIAHEIGHLVLHRELMTREVHIDRQFNVLRRDNKSATGIEKVEKEANQFAAELTMPLAFLGKAIGDHKIDIDDVVFIRALAQQFKMSEDAMKIRMVNLFLVR